MGDTVKFLMWLAAGYGAAVVAVYARPEPLARNAERISAATTRVMSWCALIMLGGALQSWSSGEGGSGLIAGLFSVPLVVAFLVDLLVIVAKFSSSEH